MRLPGNVIRAIEGDTLTVSVSNTLDEPHSFAIAGVADSGPIAPGATRRVSFEAPSAGTHLYSDALSAPVNRALGLHGALVVARRRGYAARSSSAAPSSIARATTSNAAVHARWCSGRQSSPATSPIDVSRAWPTTG